MDFEIDIYRRRVPAPPLFVAVPGAGFIFKRKDAIMKNHPDTILDAAEKVEDMVNKLKEAIGLIDKKMIRNWIEDLVLEKTFIGLRFQEAILKKIANLKGVAYKLSGPQDESRGIDGYLGDIPVSIKPISYKTKNMLPEKIGAKMIFYEKINTGLDIDAGAVL